MPDYEISLQRGKIAAMGIPQDYAERVYAGVLGKLIGVYLGRPFEGWTYDRIIAELGEITYYVNDRFGVPLIVTDDDIAGTFTFLRALPDHGNRRDLTAEEIGQTWLNYIIENRTILWWGGLGNSTEHTAYLRLKQGIPAPRSGSMALNSKVVAEQIGAQIFIDGWALVAPGDPELAVDLARRAGSVSHNGEAIYAAQVLAAMEAQAFVERDINRLIDCGIAFIPQHAIIYRMIADIRDWHARDGDWRKTRERIDQRYGYDKYGGNCHIVPNHALIILSLLYGEDDLARSLMIVNTCGWDTDCNSGNVGCLLGIKNGLTGLENGPDWRGPIVDRLYLSTADGGRGITDAVGETYRIVNSGRALAGVPPIAPKGGARFHFELPGSVQGFQVEAASDATAELANVAGHSRDGRRSLAIRYRWPGCGEAVRVTTPTFIPPDAADMSGYTLMASPTLYSGQTIRAHLEADAENPAPILARLCIQVYDEDDKLATMTGPEHCLAAGGDAVSEWRVPDTGGQPIAAMGVELGTTRGAEGTLYLDYLTWGGEPETVFRQPGGGNMWRRAWVDGIDQWDPWCPEPYRLMQNEGTGLLIQGAREWRDYRVSAPVTAHMVRSAGIGARVQGMRRYYALLLREGRKVQLVKALEGESVLAEAGFAWKLDTTYELALHVEGNRLMGFIDSRQLFDVQDPAPLDGGGVALVCEEGRMSSWYVAVQPV